jgi:hypothetical protein
MQPTAVDKVVSSVLHRASIARTLTFGRVRRRMLNQLHLRQRPLVSVDVLAQLAYNEQTRSGFESFCGHRGLRGPPDTTGTAEGRPESFRRLDRRFSQDDLYKSGASDFTGV